MNAIISLTIKDLRLLLRDKGGMFFIIAFPIIMGVAFGLMYGSVGGEGSAGGMIIGIVDNDDSEISRRFVENLAAIKTIEIHSIEQAAAREMVLKGQLLAFITIPSAFGETAGIFWMPAPELEVGVDPSRSAEAAMLHGMIMQSVGALIQDRLSDTAGFNFELARVKRVDVTRPPSKHEQTVSKLRSAWDISFPSAIMWGVMGCVAGFAISIVRERSQGTLLRLKVAPISRTHVLAGKAGACFVSALGVITLMMILGRILGIQLAQPDLLILAALCIATCFVGLMMLMSVIGKTEEAVGGAGWAIIVLMCMFGGGMMPLAFMPRFMTIISNFSPVKWGILALEGAVWRGFTVTEMLLPCGVLLAIGAVSFTIGAAIFTRQDA